jgi:hypothetical protein
MKKLIPLIFTVLCGSSLANNTELQSNATNCAKIKTWSAQYEEAVASNVGVALRDLDFRRAEFAAGQCVYVVSTPNGMMNCWIPMILQPNDKSKSVFAAVSISGNTNCTRR